MIHGGNIFKLRFSKILKSDICKKKKKRIKFSQEYESILKENTSRLSFKLHLQHVVLDIFSGVRSER